jgi:hypothetical protein
MDFACGEMHSFAPAGSQPGAAVAAADDAGAGAVCPKATLEEKSVIAADDTAAVPSHRLFTD